MNVSRKLLIVACRCVMVAFVLWLSLTLPLMLLAGGTPLNDPADYLYFITLFFLASLATVWSFTSRIWKSAYLALLIAIGALAYWWFGICRMRAPIWSDLKWFVIPNTIFAIAALMLWRLSDMQHQPSS